MEVGREIRRLREAKGWSQTKLAADAGMGVSGISQIETGARNPSMTTLARIAGALGVEVADLFPKAESRSSLEPPLFNGLEDERRDHYEAWLDFVERYASRWEEKAAAGRVDVGGVHEFIATLEDLGPALKGLNEEERRGLPAQELPTSFGDPEAKTGVAITRLLNLLNPIAAAFGKVAEEDELERLRRERARVADNFGAAAG